MSKVLDPPPLFSIEQPYVGDYRLLNEYRKIFGTSSYGEDAQATGNVLTFYRKVLNF